MSPSLEHIAEQMRTAYPGNGFGLESSKIQPSVLSHLPEQGVLLLNTALTVEKSKAGSHTKLWKPFTEQIITDLQSKDDIIWILWGNHAKSFEPLITNTTHHIITSGHPSPLNTSVPFQGSDNFLETNAILRTLNKQEIKW
jgi:uracil-DNA glycosylase